MPKGSIVSAHGYKDGWYYVEYDGKEGWAGEAYLTKVLQEEPEEEKVKPSKKEYIADYTVSATVSEIEIRYGPGMEYKKMDTLPRDASVSAYGFENGWYYIYNKEKNISGWIKEDYLKKKEKVETTPQNTSNSTDSTDPYSDDTLSDQEEGVEESVEDDESEWVDEE